MKRRGSFDETEHEMHRRHATPTSIGDVVGPAMAQLGLDFAGTRDIAPAARDSDPVTSHAAADQARAHAAAQRAEIVALLDREPLGLTADQIDARKEWRVGTASRRLIELLRLSEAERDERDTRLTRAGRPACVWRRAVKRARSA